jgi:hypothetical protein
MVQVGYVSRRGSEDEHTVWKRAIRETHEYWRPKVGDDLKHT